MKPILTGLMLAYSVFASAASADSPDSFKPLRQSEWPLWAQAQWQYQPQQPAPVYLSVRNRTRLETDDALLNQATRLEDVESGGVPLHHIDQWLRHTLHSTGNFVFSSNPDERFRIDIDIVDYQPLYTAEGQASSWRDTKSTLNRWYEAWQDPALRTQVGFHVYWQDRQLTEVRSFSTYVEARACEHFRGAAAQPEFINSPFSEHFRRSLIGQTTTALMNRVVYWLNEQQPLKEHFYPVQAVRGDRLEFAIEPSPWRVGDIVDIYHRDDPLRQLGKAQIIRQQDRRIFAQPITMSAGSVTTGDLIKHYAPPTDALLIPSRMAAANHCSAQAETLAQRDPAAKDSDATQASMPMPAPTDADTDTDTEMKADTKAEVVEPDIRQTEPELPVF